MRIEFIGHARTPVLVIDEFMPDAATLVDYAAEHNSFSHASKFYPGIRMRAPLRYVELVVALLREPIAKAFGAARALEPFECSFSLVTHRPEDLKPFQRLPHFDGTDSNELAVLHYLGAPHQGRDMTRLRGQHAIERLSLAAGIAPLAAGAGELEQCGGIRGGSGCGHSAGIMGTRTWSGKTLG